MNRRFRILLEIAPIGLVVALLSFSAQAAELSSQDLKKAKNDLQNLGLGFEISGRGIPPPPPFVYEGEFPRVELEAELESSKKILLEDGTLLPIYLTNAFKREQLSDAELVVAVRGVRAGRKLTALAKEADGKTTSEQAGTGQPATRPVVEPEGGDKPQPELDGRSR